MIWVLRYTGTERPYRAGLKRYKRENLLNVPMDRNVKTACRKQVNMAFSENNFMPKYRLLNIQINWKKKQQKTKKKQHKIMYIP